MNLQSIQLMFSVELRLGSYFEPNLFLTCFVDTNGRISTQLQNCVQFQMLHDLR